MAGVERGSGKGKRKGEWRSFPFPLARPTRSRARPNSPFPFPFQRRPRRLLYPHSSLWALPAEVNSGKSFQFFLNGYIAICLVIDLLQCLSLRQLRSCNILFPTLSAIWMCQLDKCSANNFPRGTSVTVSSPAVYGFSSQWSTVFGKRRSSTVLLAVQSICALLHNTGQYNVQLLTNSKVNRLIKVNILRL